MRWLMNLVRITDWLVALGLLVLLTAGIYSIWLDFLHKPSLIMDLATLIICSLLAGLAGKGILYLLRRKLDLAEPYEYWRADIALYYSQWGNSIISPCLVWIIYILCVLCFLPIFYSLLPKILFWILLSLLASFGIFCLSQIRYGLIQKQIQTTYFPRTQAFIDFYLLVIQGEWNADIEQAFQKIDPASTDAIIAQQIRASLTGSAQPPKTITYDYIDTGHGPGFEATPENIAAKRQADFDSFDASLKTPEHLG